MGLEQDEPEITAHPESDGSTRLSLQAGGQIVSRLWIVPFTLRVGAAVIRMDGIGGVGTEDAYRNRGYARRLLEAAVVRMREGDAAISMLYGIADFYPKFGYATAGPEHFIQLTGRFEDASLPDGWTIRPFTAADLPRLHGIYERTTARATGAAVRAVDRRTWNRLAEAGPEESAECRVLLDPGGWVAAYVWRDERYWSVDLIAKADRGALVLGEVMADGPDAADAALAACRIWAADESRRRSHPVDHITLSAPPDGTIAAASMRQRAAIRMDFQPAGGSMARTLDAVRLLNALRPELEARLDASRLSFEGALRFRTDEGDAVLAVSRAGIAVTDGSAPAAVSGALRIGGATESTRPSGTQDTLTVHLPQFELARLTLGAFPPGDLLARLAEPPDERALPLLQTLFPLRHPQMYLLDRF